MPLLKPLLLLVGGCIASAQLQDNPAALSAALVSAQADVLAHVKKVETQIELSRPGEGSLGQYLLDNKVFHKAAIFGIFNTTFLNTDVINATDTEFELVFQATGCTTPPCGWVPPDGDPVVAAAAAAAAEQLQPDLGAGAGLDADMWLRDSGAQMHYYVANGLAASSPALTRVIQALLREHVRYTLLDSCKSLPPPLST